MKTAEEWAISNDSPSQLTTRIDEQELITWIKQIQLDAWKQGMSESVLVIDKRFKGQFSPTATEVMELICKERDGKITI